MKTDNEKTAVIIRRGGSEVAVLPPDKKTSYRDIVDLVLDVRNSITPMEDADVQQPKK